MKNCEARRNGRKSVKQGKRGRKERRQDWTRDNRKGSKKGRKDKRGGGVETRKGKDGELLQCFVYLRHYSLVSVHCCWFRLNVPRTHLLCQSVFISKTSTSTSPLFDSGSKHVPLRLKCQWCLVLPLICVPSS